MLATRVPRDLDLELLADAQALSFPFFQTCRYALHITSVDGGADVGLVIQLIKRRDGSQKRGVALLRRG